VGHVPARGVARPRVPVLLRPTGPAWIHRARRRGRPHRHIHL